MSEDERTAASAPDADPQNNTQPDAQDRAEADELPTTQADVPEAEIPGNGAAPTDSTMARIAELERLLAAERDVATDYMQRWQRAAADFANYKRRAQQDQEQREHLLAAQALLPVLNALDSFERAFTALPDSLRSYTWIEGVALVDYQLRRALDAQGIAEVPAEPGQPFDPTLHQAVGEVATDQHPVGHIAVVLQRGYQAANVLMRPALVQVARAPEKVEGESATPEASQASGKSETPDETQPSGPAP